MSWVVKLRGGAYDGLKGPTRDVPPAVLVAFRHGGLCLGHVVFDPFHPDIVLATAETYRRVEFDERERVAVYEVGEGSPGPGVEERELVGAGSGPVVAHARCRCALVEAGEG